MEPKPSIIDVVQELQIMKVVHPKLYRQNDVNRDIISAFPAIATALIDAVETLEKIKDTNVYFWDSGDVWARVDYAVKHAEQALARIRSLPKP